MKPIEIHLDTAAKKTCYAIMWSYGEICVGCQCCHKDSKIRRKARLKYWKYLLHEAKHFDNWWEDNPELLALQKKNITADIKQAKKMVKYYS